MLSLDLSFFRTPYPSNPKESDFFIVTMFLELADCLRQTYSHEKKHNIVGWFCAFLLNLVDSTATELKPSLLVAKYRACYVEHLKCTDKLSEALEHAKHLKEFLTDNFGEDYSDWLGDAPNAAQLCKELEGLMA